MSDEAMLIASLISEGALAQFHENLYHNKNSDRI
jgi:hypothetical protein